MRVEAEICKNCSLSAVCNRRLIPELLLGTSQRIDLTHRTGLSALSFCRHISCPTGIEEAIRALTENKFKEYQIEGISNRELATPFGSDDKRTKENEYRIITKNRLICSKQGNKYYSTGQYI